MAVEYSHDLKAADKNIAASLELEKAAQKGFISQSCPEELTSSTQETHCN